MPNRKHIVPNGNKWSVKNENQIRPVSTHDTQHAAEQAAKDALRKSGGGEAVIHDRHGKIRDSDTIAPAKDPFPPRDAQH